MTLKNGFPFYLILISINSFLYNTKSIIFPFKIISSHYLSGYRTDKNNINSGTLETYNSSTFFDDHYINKLLSLVKLGSPPIKIISLIELYRDNLLITDFSDKNNEIFTNIDKNGYEYWKSISFKNITKNYNLNENSNPYQIKQLIAQDDIYLFTNIKDIEKDEFSCFHNFNFEIINQFDNISNSLLIGLNLDNDISLPNFMRQIYNRKIISSFIVSFISKNVDIIKGYDGLIIIGEYPHQILPDIYKEENLISFYSNQPNLMQITNFYINFDEISSSDINKSKYIFKNNRSILSLNSGLILGTIEYLDFIENNFFNKYIKLNICKEYITNTGFISDFIIISCDENYKLKLEEFPILNFNMNSENFIFEFTYEDLFTNINNKFYFLVVFETKNVIWHLGSPFFSKYTFVYNGEAKTLGFYKEIKNKEIQNKNQSNEKKEIKSNIVKIIIFLILFIIFIALVSFISYFYGKNNNKKRKKIANELDDNYEYNPSNKYKIFKKDINERNINKDEKNLELIDKTRDIIKL